MELKSTARLCHITPAPSGTSPSIFRLSRFSIHPYTPVISALGIRVALAICPPVDVIGMKTPAAPRM
jgi:hypothetical protein